jgi:hypothetical protein
MFGQFVGLHTAQFVALHMVEFFLLSILVLPINSIVQFDRVCRLFCEDPVTTQSDEFFGIFDHFITCFQEAKMDNENARKKREEEEKIAKQHQEVGLTSLFQK